MSSWQARWSELQRQKGTDPSNRALTLQEHDAFSRSLLERFGPLMGGLLVGGAIPGWQGAKAVTQGIGSLIPGANEAMDRWFPEGLQPQRGSTPGFDELAAGLRPLWSSQVPEYAAMKPAQVSEEPWNAPQPEWMGGGGP